MQAPTLENDSCVIEVSPDVSALVGLPMEAIERLVIQATLAAVSGNRQTAATILEIGERTLYRKIKEYGIQ